MSSSVQPVGSAGGPGDDPGSVDPAAKPVRRSFTAEYRARVVAEYAAAPHGGEVRGVAAGGPVSIADPGMDRCSGRARSGFAAETPFASSFGEIGRFVWGGAITGGERAVDPGIGEVAGGGGDHGKTAR